MNPRDLITAKIIADSITANGDRMTTMEIEYPRFILAELNTHRMLSKNSASSRAIPIKAMHEYISQNPAQPVSWGKNQAGMQAKEDLTGSDLSMIKYLWGKAKEDALHWARAMGDLNLHKQVANRITEPWMTMKTVISGTEWKNFFWLRAHPDAQPEINELATKMRDAYSLSVPTLLNPGEWHVPYINTYRSMADDELVYSDNAGQKLSADQAKVISASCCAQVSYRKNDDSYEKAEKIFKQLIESEPCHASPVEHQATPMKSPDSFVDLGTTHIDRAGRAWSGNLRGWVQHRKLISGEAQW